MKDPICWLERVSIIQHDNTTILEEVSFEIFPSDWVYVIGKTGSGKTSLLRTLYADLWLRKGIGSILGFSLHNLVPSEIPTLRRKIGLITQDNELFYDRSCYENLSFVLEVTGWKNKTEQKNRIEETLDRVNLDPKLLKKRPHQLSGGEQRRLSIARAILNSPNLIIADEPTGNLDPETSESIIKLFTSFNNEGTTIILSTHDHQWINEYPHRLLACKDGGVYEIL